MKKLVVTIFVLCLIALSFVVLPRPVTAENQIETNLARNPINAAPTPLPEPGKAQGQPPPQRDPDNPIGFLTGSATGDPLDIALNYLRRNTVRLQLNPADLTDFVVKDRYLSQNSGVTHIYLRQRVNGLEVFNGDININISRDGEVINLGNHFVADVSPAANATDPALAAVEAVQRAAEQLGLIPTNLSLRKVIGGPAHEVILSDGSISLDDIPAKLVYQPLENGQLRLAWDLVIHPKDGLHWWSLRVDANTGIILSQIDWVAQDNYNVYAFPKDSPDSGPRTLEINPAAANPIASPFGWHDTNGVAGPEFTVTRGNNVSAQDDIDDNNTGGIQPDGGAGLVFSTTLDLNLPPSSYLSASIINLFYWNNILHDLHYQYGFDEASGNFQQNNYGRGGAGGDAVQADTQDGSGLDNANFGSPPDGTQPRMQMYIWQSPDARPNRDSSLDNGVIIHEYGHGISTRLTGGPANSSCLGQLENGGMGEGWSDFWTLALTAQPGDTAAQGRSLGTYVFFEPPNGLGIRRYPYSTDMGVNPLTYADMPGTLDEVHNIGEIWNSMLWEVYWNLVNKRGYNSDLYNGSSGNNLALQLVMDGLKLQSCNPSFVEARNAIILADQINTGGVNQCYIWQGFAKRGLGLSATTGSNDNTNDGSAAFDLPDYCINSLVLSQSVTPNPAYAGAILNYTLVARNFLSTTVTGVILTDTVPLSTTYVAGSASNGGNISSGVIQWNIGNLASETAVTRTFRVRVDGSLNTVPNLFLDDTESGSSQWLTSHTGGTLDWALNTTNPFSGAMAWFASDPEGVSEQRLTLKDGLTIGNNQVLSFWHLYQTEKDYDGGVVEISTNDGVDWTDLGSKMIRHGYNSTIDPATNSTIAGQLAFSGDSGDYVQTVVDLSSYSGQTVLIRFRMVTDEFASGIGWFIDNIRIGQLEPLISNTAFISGPSINPATSNMAIVVANTGNRKVYLPLIIK